MIISYKIKYIIIFQSDDEIKDEVPAYHIDYCDSPLLVCRIISSESYSYLNTIGWEIYVLDFLTNDLTTI